MMPVTPIMAAAAADFEFILAVAAGCAYGVLKK